eukprot:67009_1
MSKRLLTVLTVCTGIIPSLYVIKSKFNRKQMFSAAIPRRCILMLFRDKYFMLIVSLQYVFQLFIAISLFTNNKYIYDTETSIKDPSFLIFTIWFFTFIIVSHFSVLCFRYIHSVKWYHNHGMLVIKAKFDHTEGNLNVFEPKHKNYEKKLKNILKEYTDSNKYCVDVAHISRDANNDYELCIQLSVEWNADNDIDNPTLLMESHFQEALRDIKFSKNIATFCHRKEGKLPTITIHGEYDINKIYNYQIQKFEKLQNEQLNKIKNEILNKLTPLHQLNNQETRSLITHWMLSDSKFKSFTHEIMRTIKEKNINGMSIEDIVNKMNVMSYLNDIIGEYIEPKMMKKIAGKLEELANKNLAHFNSDELAKKICLFAIDQINDDNNWLSNEHFGQFDGESLANAQDGGRSFMNILHDAIGLNHDDAQQIHKYLMKYNVPGNQRIILTVLHTAEKWNLNQYIDLIMLNKMIYDINHATVAIKLKNNLDLTNEAKCIEDMIYGLVVTRATEVNFNLISKIYELYSKIFGDLVLKEWWCSRCNYHNRICKILGKKLKYSDSFMRHCLVCGMDKNSSISNSLKGKSVVKVQKEIIPSHGKRNIFKCLDIKYIDQCGAAEMLLQFMQMYSEHGYLTYIDILSNLNADDAKQHIILKAIQNMPNMSDATNKDKQSLTNIFDNEIKEHSDITTSIASSGDELCQLTEANLFMFTTSVNENIDSRSIKHLHKLIM